MDLALEAGVSTRHLSFVETGRAQPSREMVLLLAERLDIPLREQNGLLTAAGFAPVFPERTLTDPALAAARKAMDLVLTGHEPYPALAMDRQWTMVAANRIVGFLLAGVDASLLTPPVNVLRLSLHPGGIAPRIGNFRQWRSHLLSRLRHQIDVTADPCLTELYREVCAYPHPAGTPSGASPAEREYAGIVVPLQLVTDAGTLSLFSTTTVFGTPVDITLSEIALEAFYPADDATAVLLRGLSGKGNDG